MSLQILSNVSEFKKLLRFWFKVLCVALGEIGAIGAITGLGSGLITVWLGREFGFTKPDEIRELIFTILATTIAGVILEFVIRFFLIAPAKMHREVEEQ